MSPGSNNESYPAFAHIGLRENPGKNLNQCDSLDEEQVTSVVEQTIKFPMKICRRIYYYSNSCRRQIHNYVAMYCLVHKYDPLEIQFHCYWMQMIQGVPEREYQDHEKRQYFHRPALSPSRRTCIHTSKQTATPQLLFGYATGIERQVSIVEDLARAVNVKQAPQDDRYIVLSVLRQSRKIARDLQNDLYMASGIRVSYQTRLNTVRYIEDVLEEHLVSAVIGIGPRFLFVQDNARSHFAAVTRDFLRENEIEVMEWPAISPDLNATEHLWDVLDGKVRNRHQTPQILQELGDALKEEWENIPQEEI
ncbi:hypothetical protein ANN_19360 [Periplaneta americana]|uniref:Tc1-like transposase DDE domain-containing protein n=1 Tax=Periplaneta americana TaxID=6978 RepID=A0ABQ8S9N6_PERAM|nr:hypothetical protein ANN_19360 [Periplaneta americana]